MTKSVLFYFPPPRLKKRPAALKLLSFENVVSASNMDFRAIRSMALMNPNNKAEHLPIGHRYTMGIVIRRKKKLIGFLYFFFSLQLLLNRDLVAPRVTRYRV